MNNPFLQVGVQLLEKGLHERALKYFDQAIKLEPQLPLAHLHAAQANAALERWGTALAHLQTILDSGDQLYRASAFLTRGDVFRMQQHWPLAIDDYQQVLVLAPNHPVASAHLATVEMRMLLDGETHDDVHGWLEAAQRAKDSHNLRRAAACYSEALTFASNVAEIYNQRGDCYRNLDMNQLAEADWLQVLKLEPTNMPIANKLSMLYRAQGRRDEAIKVYQAALAALQARA
jgi:tetratricopeptide (TPR) repeat protein